MASCNSPPSGALMRTVVEDRQQRLGELRHEIRQMRVAGENHMRRPDPRMTRDDALSHARRIDFQHGRVLEDAGARGFGGGGQTERVIERMQAEAARIMQAVKIARRMQRLAHPVGRPRLDRRSEFADQESRFVRHRAGVVGLRHLQPAALGQIHARHVAGGAAHIFSARFGACPERLGLFEADALDQRVGADRIARQHDTGVAAGGAPADALRLQHDDRPAEPRDLVRNGEAGEARADDADVHVELDGEPRAIRAFHPGRGIPVRPVGLRFGGQHRPSIYDGRF